MVDRVDVAVIGAGPYGLSLAVHLKAAGVEHRVFGYPMESWRSGMPPGMLLKSHAWSSNLSDPDRSFTLGRFCAQRGLPYHDSDIPVPLETFIAYGEAFQRRHAPNCEPRTLVRLERRAAGFLALFDDGAEVQARRVALAIGVHPFKHLPDALLGLPPSLASHSGDHGPLDRFSGLSVVVLGSGASATDLAALLADCGAETTLAARAEALRFAKARSAPVSLARRIARPVHRVLYPVSGIGAGLTLKLYADAPGLFHALPQRRRHSIVETTLGPLGAAQVRERVLGRMPILLGRTLEAAHDTGRGRLRLTFRRGDGCREIVSVDHVIAATGYQVDLARMTFLDPQLARAIRTENARPALSLDYETSVPGLHIVGPAAAYSFGPVSRFVFGAVHPARAVTRAIVAGRANAPARDVNAREARAVAR